MRQYMSRRMVNIILTGVVMWPVYGAARSTDHAAEAMRRALVSIVRKQRLSAEIGHSCLGSLSAQTASAGKLTNEIIKATESNDLAVDAIQKIRERVAKRVRAEFARGAVVNIDGWILSPTEVHLYALAALEPGIG